MAQILVFLVFVLSLFGVEFGVKSLKEMRYEDVVKQSFEESCGASGLASLFNLYGMDVNESKLIDDLNSTSVVSFLHLKKVAIKNDFKAEGYKITKEIFAKLTIPVIARVVRKKNYPHFVVVQNIKGDFVLIFDPNNGKFLVTKEEFYSSWIGQNSNYILVVVPNKKLTLKNIMFLDISKIEFLKDFAI